LEEIEKIFCTNENELLSLIMSSGAGALSKIDVEFSMNATAQAIAEYKPNNVTEARLVAQAQALYSQGMDLLYYATKQEWLPKEEFYLKNATKLIRLHNETVQALDKLRRGGEQLVIVQHVNVEGGAQAIVNNGNMNAGGGKEKNGK
jgi:hypothetical protein